MPKVSDMMPHDLTAAGVMRDSFASESEEEQEFLRILAAEFVLMLEETERAMAQKFDAQMFGLEEGNALWCLLPAKVRTAIKRGKG